MLKQLMISKKLEEKRNLLAELMKRGAELEQREKDLETSIEEAETEEEVSLVEQEVEKHGKETKEYEEEKTKLEGEINDLEEELRKLNEKGSSKGTVKRNPEGELRTNKGEKNMIKRGFYKGMTFEERAAIVETTEVKEFLERVRTMKGQTRGVTGAELNIPDVVLEIIRDNLHRFSKLIGYVTLKPVSGKARQNIAGTIPEGIWTETVATLNELTISFNQVEVDGYKVGGFIPVPNSTLEDSDINLSDEIFDGIGQAIGLAVDKAILYGTGTKMPLGIVTRLAQTEKPSTWGTNAPEWSDLSTSNILKLNIATKEGAAFFAALIKGLGAAKENYSDGRKVWCMNSTTKTEILSKAVTFNAAGALVAAVNEEMPVIGGKLITLPFIPDNEIIGGYISVYLLAERKGAQFAVSEHVKFIEDMTVFKGTARYDGMPVIGEGFVAVNLTAGEITKSIAFAQDAAN